MLATLYNSFFRPKIDDNEEYVRMTYRKQIHKLMPTTQYTSDTGWGCMLRVLQMAIANLLVRREGADPKSVVSLFWDNSDMPFSIQTLSKISKQIFPHKKDCQWYSPSEAGFLIQKTLQHFNTTYRVAVCNDGSIFLNQLPTDKQNLVILVMARIGLDKPQPQYLNVLVQMMDNKHFFAVLGGTPRYAHLFMKHRQGYLGMLDPHETHKAAQSEQDLMAHLGSYSGKLQWVKKQRISSSMCIMYVLKREQINQFWVQLRAVKQKNKECFFIYMAEEKPVYSNEDLMEILQFE